MRKLLLIAVIALSAYCQRPGSSILRSFDGSRIAYSDDGRGPAVFLLHGFINSGNNWRTSPLLPALLDAGYRVIIPDLRGSGQSSVPASDASFMGEAETRDLMALADKLKVKSYAVVGYSRGSIVAANWLARDSRINAAVLGGVGVDFTDPKWDRRKAFAAAFAGEEITEMTREAVDYATSIGADLKILALQQKYQPSPSPESLSRVTIPILVLRGRPRRRKWRSPRADEALSGRSPRVHRRRP